MQSEREFYRRPVSDAGARSDETCFAQIEATVSLLEDLGISCGKRHDFG